MKVKLNQQMQEVDGSPVQVTGRPPMTLKDVIINSLLSVKRNPQTGQPEIEDEKTKLDKYDLIRKIRDKKLEVELKAEEVAAIKNYISKHQPSPIIVGEALEMIEGKYKRMAVWTEEEEEANEKT